MTTEEASIYPELDDLIKIMNSLPGIEVFDCEYSKNDRISIWFKSIDKRGLFILSRALTKLYFLSFDNWIISVTTGNQFIKYQLPIYFSLFSLKS